MSLSQLNCCLKWWPFAFWHKSEKLKKNSLIAHLRQPVLSLLLSQLKPHLTIWEFSSQCSCLKYNRWPLISKLKSANKVKTIFLYWISLTSKAVHLKMLIKPHFLLQGSSEERLPWGKFLLFVEDQPNRQKTGLLHVPGLRSRAGSFPFICPFHTGSFPQTKHSQEGNSKEAKCETLLCPCGKQQLL